MLHSYSQEGNFYERLEAGDWLKCVNEVIHLGQQGGLIDWLGWLIENERGNMNISSGSIGVPKVN